MDQLVHDDGRQNLLVPQHRAFPLVQLVGRRVGVEPVHLRPDQQLVRRRRAAGVHPADHEVDIGEHGIGVELLEALERRAKFGLHRLDPFQALWKVRVVGRPALHLGQQLELRPDPCQDEIAQTRRARQVVALQHDPGRVPLALRRFELQRHGEEALDVAGDDPRVLRPRGLSEGRKRGHHGHDDQDRLAEQECQQRQRGSRHATSEVRVFRQESRSPRNL